MPNGVIEGYRIYFMTGNFTDVRSVPSPAGTGNNKGGGQEYVQQQHHQRTFPSGTVTSRINYDQSPAGVLSLDQQHQAHQTGGYGGPAVGHGYGGGRAIRGPGTQGFEDEDRALIYKLTNLSE
jgi:hypothetical protein